MTALGIYQSRINAVSAAVMAHDFAAYLACMDLPYLVQTTEASFVLHSAADLEPTFRALANELQRKGVTHYERVARKAAYQTADQIDGLHFTHMIAQGERITAPHAARQVLVRRGGVWRFSKASYPLRTKTWPLKEETLFDSLLPNVMPVVGAVAAPAELGQ